MYYARTTCQDNQDVLFIPLQKKIRFERYNDKALKTVVVHGQTYTRAGSQQSQQKTNSIHVAVIVHMCNEVPRIKAVSPASSMANVQVLFDNQTSTSKFVTIK